MAASDGVSFDRLAAPYDRGMRALERLLLRDMRAQLVPAAQGRILEIGIGTGANLPFYAPNASLTAVDESSQMLIFARRRAAALGRKVSLNQADVERLSFAADSFDTVVASLVFCSVHDISQALMEVRRVLRKGEGRFLLLEHMRPASPPLAWVTDLLNHPWYRLNRRCHLNRQTVQAVQGAGFRILRVEQRLGGLIRLVVASVT